MKPDIRTEIKLRWPDGWTRTLIELRKPAPQWRKTLDYYQSKLVRELTMMGATAVLITHGPLSAERLDPGASVWFSMVKEDYSWQTLLALGPAPRLEEIDAAYRDRIRPFHPDRSDGGDIEMFKRLTEARSQAKAWIEDRHQDRHEYVLAFDRYSTVKGNLAALWRAFANFRSLQKLGMPSILERVMDKAFKAALPMQASPGEGDEQQRKTA